jgi:hypothetical protein
MELCEKHDLRRPVEKLKEVSPGVFECIPGLLTQCKPHKGCGILATDKWVCPNCFLTNTSLWCRGCKKPNEDAVNLFDTHRLFVKPFKPGAQSSQVKDYFQSFGEVVDVTFCKRKRSNKPKTAIVTFANAEDAAACLKQPHSLEGNTLHVMVALTQYEMDKVVTPSSKKRRKKKSKKKSKKILEKSAKNAGTETPMVSRKKKVKKEKQKIAAAPPLSSPKKKVKKEKQKIAATPPLSSP